MALLMAAQKSSSFLLDVIARSIDLIARAPIMLLFVIVLLILTACAGAWATLLGIKHGKRTRIGRRRRIRIRA